jgi:sporulation protein YlmC with PRC-barrel domain
MEKTVMSYLNCDTFGMYKSQGGKGPGPALMGADTLIGNDVYNHKEEDLGDIKEIMLDMCSGKVAYAVLSFGGFLRYGRKIIRGALNAFSVPSRPKSDVS